MSSAKSKLAIVQIISKLVDLLISPKTTLPWVLHTLGGPIWVANMLVPIRESGSLLPQWYLKSQVLGEDRQRDTYWRAGILIQAVAILSFAPCFYFLTGINLGIGLMGLMAILSFGRALTSLSVKDIQGHIIPKGERGKYTGMLSSIAGITSVVSAVILIFPSQSKSVVIAYGILIVPGLLLAVCYLLSQKISVTLEASNTQQESMSLLTTLRKESPLQKLVIQRSLLLQSALMAPYFTLLILDNTDVAVGWLVLVAASATTLSSYIWGRFADEDNLWVSRVAAVLCVIAGSSLLLVEFNLWLALSFFLLLQIAHSGVRVHRKSYILDITDEQNRTAYVATANTLTGISLLVFGGFYTLLYQLLLFDVIWIMNCLIIVAICYSFSLPSPKKK